MSAMTHLNNFPVQTRGTYRTKSQDDVSDAQQLALAKALVLRIARDNTMTLLLHCEPHGGGWLIMWWPASEPRHQPWDEIINWKDSEDGQTQP